MRNLELATKTSLALYGWSVVQHGTTDADSFPAANDQQEAREVMGIAAEVRYPISLTEANLHHDSWRLRFPTSCSIARMLRSTMT
jgi:hypothetical protein